MRLWCLRKKKKNAFFITLESVCRTMTKYGHCPHAGSRSLERFDDHLIVFVSLNSLSKKTLKYDQCKCPSIIRTAPDLKYSSSLWMSVSSDSTGVLTSCQCEQRVNQSAAKGEIVDVDPVCVSVCDMGVYFYLHSLTASNHRDHANAAIGRGCTSVQDGVSHGETEVGRRRCRARRLRASQERRQNRWRIS